MRHFLIILTFLIAGCSVSPYKHSLFFSDYSHFKTSPYNKDVLIFRHPTKRAFDYTSVIIDSPLITRKKGSKLEEVQSQDLEILIEAFHTDLKKEIESRFTIVDKPAASTFRIRLAVSDIEPGRWTTNPDGNATFRFDTTLEGATLSVEGIDSLTGERIFGLINELKGRPYAAKDEMKRLINVREAFHIWIKMVGQRFDEEKSKLK